MTKKRLVLILLCCALLISLLAGCGPRSDDEEADEQDDVKYAQDEATDAPDDVTNVQYDITDTRYGNLARLGKVWGFAKYTHYSFISGQLDWDAELLNLIPVIYDSDDEDVTGILYEWFVSLGEDGYDFECEWGAVLDDLNSRPVADLSWINNGYLGVPLAARLLRFDGIRISDTRAGPVRILRTPDFSNQSYHPDMDFSDPGYRLLGLFRLWNAMNYYYPHLGILDVEWNDLLIEYIPMMLDGTDRHSYERTLAMMARHMRDSSHLSFTGKTIFMDTFGHYMSPVLMREAEGRLVVNEMIGPDNPFERGDVILGLNGRDIDEITAEMLRLLPYPTEEKALAYLTVARPFILRSHTPDMEVNVLRDDTQMVLNVEAVDGEWIMQHWTGFSPDAGQSHVLLDNNIGLINPGMQSLGTVVRAMTEFADTDGIIIDLCQYPNTGDFPFEMITYLLEESMMPFGYISEPSRTHPGARWDHPWIWPHATNMFAYIYDRPVALLMDEQTISYAESVIMFFRMAPNVTVIGPWSMGSNGNVTELPLPGGITMQFTSFGCYTLEMGQTHRIGLEPDIRVNRTIQGITEGRDEIMEAAIRYILGD
ncbi:MAG: S41 family peptidase [Oscillospiraceae bacterium]|nr:S41 family peptidase [Oscillospiraceae bacterium]